MHVCAIIERHAMNTAGMLYGRYNIIVCITNTIFLEGISWKAKGCYIKSGHDFTCLTGYFAHISHCCPLLADDHPVAYGSHVVNLSRSNS